MTPPSIYRRYFTAEECALLDATPLDDLSSEIDALRLLLARLLAACRRLREISLETHAAILSAFSASCKVIAGLFRLQCILHSPYSEVWAEIELGKNIARQRMGVFSYFAPPAGA